MSTFTLLTIREIPDEPASPEDGLLYPVPGRQTNTIEMEELDGDDVVQLQARSVKLRFSDEKKPLLRASDIRIDAFVTASRVAFACSKFDKGGGWIGGPAVLALNAGSKMLAARRRRGKMLVGQVRYPWVSAVYAQAKTGMLGDETIRLVVKTDGRLLMLDLTLPKSVNACALGTEIAQRAARFRLAHEPSVEDAERTSLEEIAQIEQFVSMKSDKSMAGVSFPSVWPPSERSARFGRAVEVEG